MTCVQRKKMLVLKRNKQIKRNEGENSKILGGDI